MNETQTTRAESQRPWFRYEDTAALHATQFAINTMDETIVLECSTGFVMDDQTGRPVLPIDGRIAMEAETARALGELLISVADELECVDQECRDALLGAVAMHDKVSRATQGLPRFDD
ncbi:MAG: hypothetical protein QGG36_18210 [Pirellulaceae bacterium]|jgi:hypothetical protein|nr:hypothetical protein [Pirellulaceae bacterium]